MEKLGMGGNFISSHQTVRLFREAYHTSTIFPRLGMEKWQEVGYPTALKYLRERTLDLLHRHNYPDD